MRNEEFIRLDGQAVRLSSVTRDGDVLSLVVIVRGNSSRDELQALLARDSFTVSLGEDPERPMRAEEIDLRSSGEGPTSVHRFAIVLEPASDRPTKNESLDAQSELMQRLARIERKLDAIIARLDSDTTIPF